MQKLLTRANLATYGTPPQGCDENGCCRLYVNIGEKQCKVQMPVAGWCKQQGQSCAEGEECCSSSCDGTCIGWGIPKNPECPVELDPSCIIPNAEELPKYCRDNADCPPANYCRYGFCHPPVITKKGKVL